MKESEEAPSISVLPERCISDILSVTSPRDASRVAAISKNFYIAADSDAVWDRFLPSDYRKIIARAVSPLVFDSKKQLYLLLSDSNILLDRGRLVRRSIILAILYVYMCVCVCACWLLCINYIII